MLGAASGPPQVLARRLGDRSTRGGLTPQRSEVDPDGEQERGTHDRHEEEDQPADVGGEGGDEAHQPDAINATCAGAGTIGSSASADSPPPLAPTPDRARRSSTHAGLPDTDLGRDEQRTGDMWNSNSLVAWLLAVSGHAVDTIAPPPSGRAPGWDAGLVVAR
jgi:hypothetical protein